MKHRYSVVSFVHLPKETDAPIISRVARRVFIYSLATQPREEGIKISPPVMLAVVTTLEGFQLQTLAVPNDATRREVTAAHRTRYLADFDHPSLTPELVRYIS